MSCSESISLLANICTVIGFVFAIFVFTRWKKQSNYDLKRDVLFEAEFATLNVLTSLIATIQNYAECKRIYLVNSNNKDPAFLREDFKQIRAQFDLSVQKYHESQIKLNLCNINLDFNVVLRKEGLSNRLENMMSDLHVVNSVEGIQDKLDMLIQEINTLSHATVQFLSETRANL